MWHIRNRYLDYTRERPAKESEVRLQRPPCELLIHSIHSKYMARGAILFDVNAMVEVMNA